MEVLELEPIFLPGELESPHKVANTTNTAAVSYATLLRHNRPFTLYLCSYITNHIGEWLTYLASLTALRAMHDNNNNNNNNGLSTTIGLLVALRLLTNVVAAPWGGALADAMDRRKAMILLDFAGALIAWLFILAVQLESPALIFVATVLQAIDSGLYEPSRSAIVPLLCPTDGQLEKATLLTCMAWSIVAATASAAGGVLVTFLGLQGCFVADSLTYVGSALFMTCVPGDWSVPLSKKTSTQVSMADKSSSTNNTTSHSSAWTMVQDGWMYLHQQPWGLLVALKFSATWLTMDVLLVDFAQRGGADQVPMHLGALFGAVGLGCLIGPPLADQFTDLHRPSTLKWAAVTALGLTTTACLLISLRLLGNPLWLLCLFTVLRSSGVAILWIQSSLLLQKLSDPTFLGRVSSMDYGLALGGEAVSALVTGRLRDGAGWSAEQVCSWLAALGLFFTGFWIYYMTRGGGAPTSDSPGKADNDARVSSSESITDEEEDTEEDDGEMVAIITQFGG